MESQNWCIGPRRGTDAYEAQFIHPNGGDQMAREVRLYQVQLGDRAFVVRASHPRRAQVTILKALRSSLTCNVIRPEQAFQMARNGAQIVDPDDEKTWPAVDDKTIPLLDDPLPEPTNPPTL
jgi:hypothetical protein